MDATREEIEVLHARLDAHRAVLSVIAVALGDVEAAALIEVMTGLHAYERTLRRLNAQDGVLSELREVRELVGLTGLPLADREGAIRL